MKFDDKLQQAIKKAGSVLCIGLDPNPDQFPEAVAGLAESRAGQVLAFCTGVIKATHRYACAYKINTAYFEALGKEGFDILGHVKEMIPPGIISIADAKRGDVGHTAEQYKKAFFDVFDFDAVTLSPLIGIDTLKPWLQSADKGIFVLTLTSNPGSEDFFLRRFELSENLSCHIAGRLRMENQTSATSIGMVVGATQNASAAGVLQEYPDSNLLIPGVGAQGGSLLKLQRLLESHLGFPLVAVSRGILYPAAEPGSGWEQAIGKQAGDYHRQLQHISDNYV
ncbi:MAG: orotidine-5'-phosphate decarboxylase [Balneolales bacterium]